MNTYGIFPKGMNTVVAGWTQIIGGLLFALSELLRVATSCLNGTFDLGMCIDALPPLVIAVAVAANGLGQLGLGGKVEEVKEVSKSTEATVDTIKESTSTTEASVAVIEETTVKIDEATSAL